MSAREAWEVLKWLALLIFAAFAIYLWHGWVAESDRRIAAQIERQRCIQDLHGSLIDHVCYLPNRRK